jgi:RNA polymerase sigma-70 factor (ECF subfamily)
MLMIMLIYTKDDELYVEKLYLELKDDMLYVANKILRNQDDAEDAVHAAFTNIIKHLQRIQSLQNVHEDSRRKSAAYCIVIVKNISRRMYNNKKAKATSSIDDVDYNLPSEENTEEYALQNDLLASLDEVVKVLPENLSKPFILRYYKEMKYADIGRILNLTANAVQKRVERATDIILEKLGEEGMR